MNSKTIRAPFTISVDGREKQPYRFNAIKSDTKDNHAEFIVRCDWSHLKTGDYSIEGYEDCCAVERKSKEDCFATIGQHRERFKREHERLAELDYSAVVVEASMSEILKNPPEFSKLSPKVVIRTALSWSTEFGVQWFFCADRRMAEVVTFRLLNIWWKKLEAKRQRKTS